MEETGNSNKAAMGGGAQMEEFVKVTGLLVVDFRTVQKGEENDATWMVITLPPA